MTCPLCNSIKTTVFCLVHEIQYRNCENCKLVFKEATHFLSKEEEKKRYQLHENDVDDKNYQNFVSPIVNSVLKDLPSGTIGLDYGAGPGPVIANMLRKKNYKIILYDPYFHPDKRVLNTTYDFIVCCEVMEHFQEPAIEFKLLQKLLKKGGKLYCMTELLPKQGEFKDWYYKNDPTHVVFYSEKNLNWIKEAMGFEEVSIEERVIIFNN